MVILLVLIFGSSSNLAAAYGIAVTGAMLIDAVLIAVVLSQPVEVEPLWSSIGAAGALLHRRPRSISAPTCSRSPTAAGSRCCRRDRLHPAHHLGEGPQADDRPDERGEPADRGVHQVGRDQRRARSGHRGVHDQLDQRRAARAAAQPQAQQGASRAGHAADRADRGRALRRQREARSRSRIMARASIRVHPPLRLHGGDRRSRRACQARGLRAGRSR